MAQRYLLIIDQDLDQDQALIEMERRLPPGPAEIRVSMIGSVNGQVSPEAKRSLGLLLNHLVEAGRPARGIVGGSDLPSALRSGLDCFAPQEVIVLSEQQPESISDLAQRAAAPVTTVVFGSHIEPPNNHQLQAAVPRTFSPLEPVETRALLSTLLNAVFFVLLLNSNPESLLLSFLAAGFIVLSLSYPALLLIVHSHQVIDHRSLTLARWIMGLVLGSIAVALLFAG